jgi:hypothetical protein
VTARTEMPLKSAIGTQRASDDAMLDQLQRETFAYFPCESSPENGLVRDKNAKDWPASIAATGLALASYPIGVERFFLTREDAIKRTLVTLRFFSRSRQGTEVDATGYRGFYYPYGFKGTFNPTYPGKGRRPRGWVTPWHFGLNQGPIVLMIENYRTGFLWRLMRRCSYMVNGLRRAGFRSGWLEEHS